MSLPDTRGIRIRTLTKGKMMDFSRYTNKAQQSILKAQNVASE